MPAPRPETSENVAAGARRRRELRELVHQTAVKRLLFRRVVVVHVAGVVLARIQTHRLVDRSGLVGVLVVVQQSLRQSVHRRRSRLGPELHFAPLVRRLRIRCEIVVERNVFLENHHYVLDRCRCCPALAVLPGAANVVPGVTPARFAASSRLAIQRKFF